MKKIWKIFVGVIFLAVCSGCGIKKEQKKTIEDTKEKIYRECEMLAEGYRNIYENAVKENALYELSTIQKSMDYFGKYGYAVIDSYNQLDMVQSIKVDDFLKKAEKDSSVCAEFARSATKAENYGGNNDKEGYTNMVDLGHLAQNAEGLIGESKAQIEKALSDAIVYKINGDYRRHASGLSVYYSYDGDQESAARYQQIAAENIYSSFVNYSIGANIR